MPSQRSDKSRIPVVMSMPLSLQSLSWSSNKCLHGLAQLGSAWLGSAQLGSAQFSLACLRSLAGLLLAWPCLLGLVDWLAGWLVGLIACLLLLCVVGISVDLTFRFHGVLHARICACTHMMDVNTLRCRQPLSSLLVGRSIWRSHSRLSPH